MTFEIVWSGTAERQGTCAALSGYRGPSPIAHLLREDQAPPAPVVEVTRRCVACRLTKAITAFDFDPRTDRGRFGMCRPCRCAVFGLKRGRSRAKGRRRVSTRKVAS